MSHVSAVRLSRHWLTATAAVLVAACGDTAPTATETPAPDLPAAAIQALDCVATISTGTVSCGPASSSGARRTIIGGQNDFVRLTSSNLTQVGGALELDVTVQNLLPEAIGTPDGVVVDPDGVTVFFAQGPTVIEGTGTAWVDNADGVGDFTGSNQPYFRYPQMLVKDEVSAAKPWRLAYDPGVQRIAFKVYVSAEVQPLLVINEVMVNPAGPTTSDLDREWFEVYNAGRLPVQMQGMVIADSAASGRRPYHLISSELAVAPGAYVVIGGSTNTVTNGGVPVDYAYGAAMNLQNSLDALKVSRVYGTDTLTIDRTQYASAAVSAQTGIARELKNPGLDNANMDGSNWADASVVSVYGDGGRGTPKAQNSTYTP